MSRFLDERPIDEQPSSDELNALVAAAAEIVGDAHVRHNVPISDASGLAGQASVLAAPATTEEVRQLVAHGYAQGIGIVPVGGQTGYSGGVVPVDRRLTLAISLVRLNHVRQFDPLLWRIEVEAGVTTATVARLARENGLLFGPDPGAPEQSQIGGNIATNAAGPHAFKYGPTVRWVTGVEAVLAPGEVVWFGGSTRKDVAGYDLRGLLAGSEGTLGIITAAWLRLTPAPEQTAAIVAGYRSVAEGVEAIYSALASGIVPATLDFVAGHALRHAPPPFVQGSTPTLLVIGQAESDAEADALIEAFGPTASRVDEAPLWRWRGGVSLAVRAVRGGLLAEDIAVPLEFLAQAIEQTVIIGQAHGLEAASWGHGGDGNVHSAFLYDPSSPGDRVRLGEAAAELLRFARSVGGTVSAEHGLGKLKAGELVGQWAEPAVQAHEAIKRALDPKGLLNPGTKLARPLVS